MKRTASGEQLWRDMRVVVCLPEQKDIVFKRHAKSRHGWTKVDLDTMLEHAVDYVENKFPSIQFRLVELAANDFKLIYAGRKESMSELNGCPEIARSPKIAETICAKEGHHLSVYQNGMTNTPNGPQMNTINFCSACGLSLAEVRGDLDSRINAAVEQGIKERFAAMANAKMPAPAGQPGIQVVPDATKPVESPS